MGIRQVDDEGPVLFAGCVAVDLHEAVYTTRGDLTPQSMNRPLVGRESEETDVVHLEPLSSCIAASAAPMRNKDECGIVMVTPIPEQMAHVSALFCFFDQIVNVQAVFSCWIELNWLLRDAIVGVYGKASSFG